MIKIRNYWSNFNTAGKWRGKECDPRSMNLLIIFGTRN